MESYWNTLNLAHWEEVRNRVLTDVFAYFATAVRWINVKDYGALGDDATDDTDAVLDAIVDAAALDVPLYFPRGVYLLDPDIFDDYLTGNGAKIYGDGVNTTLLKLRSAGNYFTGTLGGGCGIIGIHASGEGYAASFLEITGGGADFRMMNCRFEEFDDAAIIIAADTCSQSKWVHCHIVPNSSGDTVIQLVATGSDSASVPRHFVNWDCSSGVWEIGNIDDLFLHDIMARNISQPNNSSLGLHMIGCKWASVGGATTLKGVNTFALGCTFAGDVTLDSSFDHSVYVGNRSVSLTVNATAAGASAANIIVDASCVIIRSAYFDAGSYRVNGTEVLTAQMTAEADLAGGATLADVITKVNAMLAQERSVKLRAT